MVETIMINVPESANIIVGFVGINLLLLAIIILLITGAALYKAARLKDFVWFWAILIFNTLGILPLIYLILKRKKQVTKYKNI